MQNNKSIYTISYMTIIAMVSFQAMFTVFQLSQTIGFGQKVSQLNMQKNNMLAQRTSLQKNLSDKTSLYQLDEEVENEFLPISDSMQILDHTSVALR